VAMPTVPEALIARLDVLEGVRPAPLAELRP
jgi:hypothetical protein